MAWPLASRLSTLLGIDYPIVQSGMGGIAGVDLAAAVCNSGGLGILAGHTVPLSELRDRIRVLRKATSKPFGVNVLIPDDLVTPASADSLDAGLVAEVQSGLNRVRRKLSIPEREGAPERPTEDMADKLSMLMEERVPVLSFGLGDPGSEFINLCREKGIQTLAMVTTVGDAVAVERSGIDAVVAQGGEAGGHRSHFTKPSSSNQGVVGTMVLVPAVCDAVKIPVLAAGGIVDGRGVAAALALGADGIMVGTRFVATRESLAVDAYKAALLKSDANDTVVTDAVSGRYARLIDNELLRIYRDATGSHLPFMWQGSAVSDVLDAAREQNNERYLALWAGQSAGLIRDLPPASEIIARLVEETREALSRLRIK